MKNILVTGGAGFIGSNLVAKLAEKNKVAVFDNFSEGKREYLPANCEIIKGDILDAEQIKKALKEIEVCYHFAADPRVKESFYNPVENFNLDAAGTLNILEACRKNSVKTIVFASSSAVYGNAEMPTPETAPISVISNYAAAKASSENYITSYSRLYGLRAIIVRYANIIGPHSTHGVVFDFFQKLKKTLKELEILGDGKQKKSYLHVSDCADATIFLEEKIKGSLEVFNVGSEEQITTKEIADIVAENLGLRNVKYRYTGGSQGWPGDVPLMLLSIEKLKSFGWKPRISTKEAVVDTVKFLSTLTKHSR